MTLTFKVPPLASGKELCDIDRGYFRATKTLKDWKSWHGGIKPI